MEGEVLRPWLGVGFHRWVWWGGLVMQDKGLAVGLNPVPLVNLEWLEPSFYGKWKLESSALDHSAILTNPVFLEAASLSLRGTGLCDLQHIQGTEARELYNDDHPFPGPVRPHQCQDERHFLVPGEQQWHPP
jgi:hypothetical protein